MRVFAKSHISVVSLTMMVRPEATVGSEGLGETDKTQNMAS
jgi:hypothetical protein